MIDKDERLIKKHIGKGNPFRVPEGYFDALPSRVMDSIRMSGGAGERRAAGMTCPRVVVPLWRRYRKAVASVAAGVCVAVLSLGAYLHDGGTGSVGGGHSGAASAQQLGDAGAAAQRTGDGVDAMMDYSMMDSDDMYALMADLN